MDNAWRFRLVLVMTFAVIIFGDMLGFSRVNGDKNTNGNHATGIPASASSSSSSGSSGAGSSTKKTREQNSNAQPIGEAPTANEIEHLIAKKANSNAKLLQIDMKEVSVTSLREACLPKLLCEIAAKPTNIITDKEQNLMELIRSTTVSFIWQFSTPTKWHFAAHMGQLMRDTIDTFGRATGCSELWPQCPLTSAALMKLNAKDGASLGTY